MNKETLRMQMLAGIITEGQYKAKLNENMEDWGRGKDDNGNSEEDYIQKPSLADFGYDKKAYTDYMEEKFPGEPLDLQEGDDIFNQIDQEIIIPDQDSNYANGTTDDEDGTNYGINFLTTLPKNESDYTDEQKKNFLIYLKKRSDDGNEKAIELINSPQYAKAAQDFL
jgi:hypothetical protein